MPLTTEFIHEFEILTLFDLDTTQGGLKIHTDAGDEKVAAAKRLFNKGMLTQPDGGYLTDRGLETAENAHRLVTLLRT